MVERVIIFKETFTDQQSLKRFNTMFQTCTLDDAESFEIGERFSNIVFLRNGSRFTFNYDTAYPVDQLISVSVEPV